MVLAEETRLARLTTSPDVKMNGVAMVTGLALSGLAFTWFCIASCKKNQKKTTKVDISKSEY